MHINKHFLFVIGTPALLVLLVVVIGLYRLQKAGQSEMPLMENNSVPEERRVVLPEGGVQHDEVPRGGDVLQIPEEPLSHEATTSRFTGILSEVNTGCFADGECFVVVDGKHVTAILGRSQQEVGEVRGVEGFGDLRSHIGEPVEVYASVLEDGSYSLYGSNAFYIILKSTAGHVSNANERPEVQ